MNRKVQYALIGAGAAVRRMHDVAIEKSDNEVIAVCDVLEDRARAAGAHFNCPWFTDYRQLLDEIRPEAVVIIAQHRFHAEIAVAALRAGAHVLCEKPMGLQVAEADAMNQAAAEADRLLAINYQQRTRPETVAAKRIIDSGQLGT
ncbi:MAG: Gfo/Idh/MocA family oxidoreductase, partial [Anaerolineaceae bacterium]|nr:Gfo/Idh/MocA family oxidoreductase [Anaerolineaceae bacterium]